MQAKHNCYVLPTQIQAITCLKDRIDHLNCHRVQPERFSLVREVYIKWLTQVLNQSGTNVPHISFRTCFRKAQVLRSCHERGDRDSKNAKFWHGKFGQRNTVF